MDHQVGRDAWMPNGDGGEPKLTFVVVAGGFSRMLRSLGRAPFLVAILSFRLRPGPRRITTTFPFFR